MCDCVIKYGLNDKINIDIIDITNYNKYFDYQLQNNLLCRYDVDKLNNIEKILCIDKNYPLYQFSNKIKYCFYEIKYYNKNIVTNTIF